MSFSTCVDSYEHYQNQDTEQFHHLCHILPLEAIDLFFIFSIPEVLSFLEHHIDEIIQ